jgi:putative peptidoglycan lipid II flippase
MMRGFALKAPHGQGMNLLKTLATVSSMTLLSRILGFVRDFVIARTLVPGCSPTPSLSLSSCPTCCAACLPKALSRRPLCRCSANTGTNAAPTKPGCSWIVSAACFFSSSWRSPCSAWPRRLLVYLSAPGFSDDPEKFALTVNLTRITFPYILFMSLVALAGGVLNTWSRFAVPAFTPVLLNVSFILMALFATPHFEPPIMALGWAVFLGGALQLAFQIPACSASACCRDSR